MARQQVLYGAVYPWYVALAAADVLLTWFILTMDHVYLPGVGEPLKGMELNVIADRVWHAGGSTGLVALKFASVFYVLIACEFIGRRQFITGRRLAKWAAVLNAVPVVVGGAQLAAVSFVFH
ncbi:MAG TPA: hypothetical protein VG797_01155 [Phycisphaerales bacterium]|nr:hypothetical protein [Phycisphaerales bacterium]